MFFFFLILYINIIYSVILKPFTYLFKKKNRLGKDIFGNLNLRQVTILFESSFSILVPHGLNWQ